MIVHGSYRSGSLIFSGSFNPLHDAHRAMARIAAEKFSAAVQPEISISNVDKPDIDAIELDRRLRCIHLLGDPLVTRAALFSDKADCFPGCRFIIGADTALRLDAIQYAGGSPFSRDALLRRIAQRGCRFVVFGRLIDDTFHDAAALPLCDRLLDLCDFVPQSEFRHDISSTQLRDGSP